MERQEVEEAARLEIQGCRKMGNCCDWASPQSRSVPGGGRGEGDGEMIGIIRVMWL